MKVDELDARVMVAAEALRAARKAGALVLRVWDGHIWHLRIWNGAAIPLGVRRQLLNLTPYVFILLAELPKRKGCRYPI